MNDVNNNPEPGNQPERPPEPVEQRITKFSNVLEQHVDGVVKGQPGVVRHILVALMVGGHVLLEGNPATPDDTERASPA